MHEFLLCRFIHHIGDYNGACNWAVNFVSRAVLHEKVSTGKKLLSGTRVKIVSLSYFMTH